MNNYIITYTYPWDTETVHATELPSCMAEAVQGLKKIIIILQGKPIACDIDGKYINLGKRKGVEII